MERRGSKGVSRRPKESENDIVERDTKRVKRTDDANKPLSPSNDVGDKVQKTGTEDYSVTLPPDTQTESSLNGPPSTGNVDGNPSPSDDISLREMDKASKKTSEPRGNTAGGSGGSSADDGRNEFRRVVESSGLQGILKSFGRVDELFGVGQSTGKRLKDIVENLNSQEIAKIRAATDDLNNLLNNTAEDAYSTFPIDQIMPALIRCMSFDEDFDVTLKAIRCLGTFARSLPSSCNAMVTHGAVPALCTRLLSIEVIDVAEESIRAIKYIAKENPEACLMNGALCAVLSYLDFFSHHEQRDAVESAAHMCRGLKPENCGRVVDQVPTLVNLLGYEDPVLVEKAAQALLSVTEVSVHNPGILQILSETALIGKALELMSGASIITLCAKHRVQVAELLLISNVSEILLHLFSSCASGWGPGSSPGIVKTPDQLTQILMLTESLLPTTASQNDASDAMDITSEEQTLMEFFVQNPETITKFGNDLLPVLLQVHNVTSSQPVRANILHIWSIVVKLINRDAFEAIARKLKIASLLGPLLLSSQDEIVVQAMSLVEALIQKLPEVFKTAFVEEGVVHAAAHLAFPNTECELTGVRRSPRLQERRQAEGRLESHPISTERQEAVLRAQNFISTHFYGFSVHQDTDRVVKIKTIISKLNDPEKSLAALSELLRIMNEEEGLSTFEFLRSKVVQSLNAYLSIDIGGNQRGEDVLLNVEKLIQAGLCFSSVESSSPLQGLVHKLRDAVAACEAFPVRHVIQRNVRTMGPSTRTGSDEARNQNTRLASLGQPLKLKLERHDQEKELKDVSQNQILVEPLVGMHSLEEYLWPRVRPGHEKQRTVEQTTEQNDPSNSAKQESESGKSLSGMMRRIKYRPGSKTSSRQEASPDPESMSCSHDDSHEGNALFQGDDLLLDEDDGVDDEMSDEDDFDDDEDEIEGLSHVHSLRGTSEDVDEAEDGGGPSSSSDRRSYAHRLMQPREMQLEFCIGDVVIKPTATIFQASIAMRMGYEDELECKDNKIASFRHRWEDTHVVTYRRRARSERIDDSYRTQQSCNASSEKDVALMLLKNVQIPEELEVDDELRQLLRLLKMLDTINSMTHRFQMSSDVIRQLSRSEFISSKLSMKLSQQIQDPLTICSNSSPSWTTHLVTSCKFLFPFELRRKFFFCKLDTPRALLFFNKEYEAAGERKDTLKVERGDTEVKLSLLKPNRVRVSRSKILGSAMQIMEMYAHNTLEILEVHYYNESGVGEGPTLEFYTLMSQELQKRELQMWRDEISPTSDESTEAQEGTVYAPRGLFPRPYPLGKTPKAIIELFLFMGKAVARSLIDGRLMDLNIHPLFFRILRDIPVDLWDVQSVDPQLGATLEKLHSANQTCQDGKVAIDGVLLEDLCLPYTLPGYEDVPFMDSDGSEFVNGTNVGRYIDSVVSGTLQEGVETQICAFREGFESVIPVKMLEIFYEDELDLLLRGTQGCWTIEELSESVNFSHGYSPLCDQARWFLEILSELDDTQRRSFLQFLTGSPRLPPGGIAALSPKLTVVQRLNSREGSSENDLPSVATCVNFLKLPKYGSKEVMKERLTIAFNEGQYAFDLS